MTNDLPLEGLEALEQAATPGPWEVTKDDHGNEHVCDKEGLFIAEFADGENEDLVIALRNAAPSLFARIRQAERELAEAQEAWADAEINNQMLHEANAILSGYQARAVTLERERDEARAIMARALMQRADAEKAAEDMEKERDEYRRKASQIAVERDLARRERDDLSERLHSAVYSGQSIAFDPSAYPADWPGNIDDGPPIPAELAWMAEGALAAEAREALAIKGVPEWDRHLDRWAVTVIDRDGHPTRYACSDLAQLVTERGPDR